MADHSGAPRWLKRLKRERNPTIEERAEEEWSDVALAQGLVDDEGGDGGALCTGQAGGKDDQEEARAAAQLLLGFSVFAGNQAAPVVRQKKARKEPVASADPKKIDKDVREVGGTGGAKAAGGTAGTRGSAGARQVLPHPAASDEVHHHMNLPPPFGFYPHPDFCPNSSHVPRPYSPRQLQPSSLHNSFFPVRRAGDIAHAHNTHARTNAVYFHPCTHLHVLWYGGWYLVPSPQAMLVRKLISCIFHSQCLHRTRPWLRPHSRKERLVVDLFRQKPPSWVRGGKETKRHGY
jgi:hypothetical protein